MGCERLPAKILDDDLSLAIDDVRLAEGNSGTTSFVFTVSLSAAASFPVTVKYATADGTATAPADYTAIGSGTLTFAAGETSKTITVKVKGDTTIEADETFFVNLSSPVNAMIAAGQGTATIRNDDGMRGGSIRLASAPSLELGTRSETSTGGAPTRQLDASGELARTLGSRRRFLDQDLDKVAQELAAMVQSRAGAPSSLSVKQPRPNATRRREAVSAPV